MIPQRCYSDILELIDLIRRYNPADCDASWVLGYTIRKLECIIKKWEESDDKELSTMAEEYEKSEKDCMWERE